MSPSCARHARRRKPSRHLPNVRTLVGVKRALLVVALALGLAVVAGLVSLRAHRLSSSSMEPSFATGALLVSSALAYVAGGGPARGDAVVFVDPCRPGVQFVKRVVAVDEAGFVAVNGAPEAGRRGEAWSGEGPVCPLARFLHEGDETLHCADTAPASPADGELAGWKGCDGNPPAFPWKVPPGNVFLLGDHRTNSADSRHWGFVPVDHVLGRVVASF
jgi:signal peptidase I